ncbi:MAG: Adenosine monophosphate-protein transferase SoFic [Chlamydiae bacterium]|nr:Adenosine monophosphate-protein transferase SoFic [Chlamydiota bacterium]
MFEAKTPYNALPPLPPPKEKFHTPEIWKKTIEAHRELAELKGMSPQLPNQAILIQSIGLQEARVSSEIENIVTTNDELYRSYADRGMTSDPHTKEVLGYNEALWYGYRAIKEENRILNLTLFEELVQLMTQHSSGVRKLPGTVLKNPLENKVVYTPPEGESVIRDMMDHLSKFIYIEQDIDPLIILALLHYQFEAIHPFHDGNGRTGRIVNILYLVEKELLNLPILYLSKYVIENKAAYYEGLRNVTQKGEWETWILFILNAVQATAKLSREKIRMILNVRDRMAQQIQDELPRIYSKDLVELLFEHPYCKIRFLEHLVHRQTASQYLQKLEKIGILRQVKRGREKYFVNDAFLEVLKNH